MSYEDIRTLVIDSGGDCMKAGFGKDNSPCSVFPTIIARPYLEVLTGMDGKYVYVGHEIMETKRKLKPVKSPIEHGCITNWDEMERVWHHLFYHELRVEPEEHPVLLTEPPINPKANREKTTQIMFETFNIPALYKSNSALLSLYGAGRTTGIVLELGHTVSHTAPVASGNLLTHATQRLAIAGSQLTDYLTESLSRDSSCALDSCSVRHIKEKLTHVSLCCKQDTAVTPQATAHPYELPDGKVISLGSSELSRCPEALFNPSLLLLPPNSDQPQPTCQGIHESVCVSLNKCDPSIRKHLYANIVLSGGSSLFPGIKQRLEREISLLSPLSNKPRVIAPAERKYLPWIGGANLASLSTFNSMWYSKEEYDESGPSIVTRKIF